MPLPSNFSTQTTTLTPRELIEEGIYDAVLDDVDFKVNVETPWGIKDQITFIFSIPELDRKVFHSVNNSWSPGGQYQPSGYFVVGTALGLPKSKEAPAPAQVNGLIGKSLKLIIKQVLKKDGVTKKNKITDFVAAVSKK